MPTNFLDLMTMKPTNEIAITLVIAFATIGAGLIIFNLQQSTPSAIPQIITTNLTDEEWCNLTESLSMYPSIESRRISYNCTNHGEGIKNDSPFFKYYK